MADDPAEPLAFVQAGTTLDTTTIDRLVEHASSLDQPMRPIPVECRSCGWKSEGVYLLTPGGLMGDPQRHPGLVEGYPPPWLCMECHELAVYPVERSDGD